MNLIEFTQGQEDCKAGKPHNGGSESYEAGYSFQYQKEAIEGASYE